MRSVRLRAALAGAVLAVAVTPVAAQAHRHHDSLGEKTSKQLRAAIKDKRMFKHLEALATIATENGGNRASGFQGYGASAQYILTELRAAGYKPTVQTFNFVTFEELSDPVLKQLTPTAKTYTQEEFATMNYSASGDTGAQAIVPVDVNLDPVPANRLSTSGCEDADFAGFPAGAIALMQRGTCDFAVKVVNAQEAGASGAIVFNQGNDPGRTGVVAGTLAETAQDGQPTPPDVTIPAVGISYAEGERLAKETSPTGQVIVDAKSDRRVSSNILADTRSGNRTTSRSSARTSTRCPRALASTTMALGRRSTSSWRGRSPSCASGR